MRFGDFEIHFVSDGHFRLDGGAMFGVVPKVLWERTDPPNDKNRILLGLNCLLIKSSSNVILVDTGIGKLNDDKFSSMFEVDHSKHDLLSGLQKLEVSPDDVTHVVLTHLHFDHSGGNCRRSDNDEIVPAFPNAVYIFQKGEYEYAQSPDPRSRASYLSQNWQSVVARDQLSLIEGNVEIVPGIETFVTGGHTRDHQIIKIKSQGKTACFLADLAPTTSHLKTPYVMGYDLYPKQTMGVKAQVLGQALEERWLLLFEHAPHVRAGYLYDDDGKVQLEKVEL